MRSMIFILALVFTVSAQAQSAFLDAMRYVPAESFFEETGNIATFADIPAGFAATDTPMPSYWADIEPGSERSVFRALPYGLASSVTTYLMMGGPLYPELLGLDFFDLSGTVEFGVPPNQALVLIGGIAPARVSLAFLARGYRLEGELLCPEAGCDAGREMDINNREPGNPFGGDLGRSFPVFTSPGVLAGSASDVLARQMASSATGDLTSLADLPEVQALDTVLSQMQHVLSVTIVNPIEFMAFDPLQVLGRNFDAESASALLEQVAAVPLPAYSLVAFAATADESTEFGHVMLVYPDAGQAAAAADSLDERLHSFMSQRDQVSYAETLSGTEFELAPATVMPESADGVSVVLVSLSTPLSNTDDAPFVGLVYRSVINLMYQRDYLWLIP